MVAPSRELGRDFVVRGFTHLSTLNSETDIVQSLFKLVRVGKTDIYEFCRREISGLSANSLAKGIEANPLGGYQKNALLE